MNDPPVLYSEQQVSARVHELAQRISKDYASMGEVLLIGVLKGAFIFLADLARRLTVPRRVDFMSVASYGGLGADRPQQGGAVRLLLDLREDIAGKHVLLVEDIVDTGTTLAYLQRMLKARRPASLKTCALIRKAIQREQEPQVDYLGFEIEDDWVVGYGLDNADQYRTLPYLGILEP